MWIDSTIIKTVMFVPIWFYQKLPLTGKFDYSNITKYVDFWVGLITVIDNFNLSHVLGGQFCVKIKLPNIYDLKHVSSQ